MTLINLTRAVVRSVAIAIVAVGFAPYSGAAVITSEDFIKAEMRAEQISDIQALLARDDVSAQLESYGVSPELVAERIANLTVEELAALQGAIDEQVAGGDALALIGAVFLVLLILELVGVTNIFNSF
jgi:hypothetical protein